MFDDFDEKSIAIHVNTIINMKRVELLFSNQMTSFRKSISHYGNCSHELKKEKKQQPQQRSVAKSAHQN